MDVMKSKFASNVKEGVDGEEVLSFIEDALCSFECISGAEVTELTEVVMLGRLSEGCPLFIAKRLDATELLLRFGTSGRR